MWVYCIIMFPLRCLQYTVSRHCFNVSINFRDLLYNYEIFYFTIGHQPLVPVTDSASHSCPSEQSSGLVLTSGATQLSLQGITMTTVYMYKYKNKVKDEVGMEAPKSTQTLQYPLCNH